MNFNSDETAQKFLDPGVSMLRYIVGRNSESEYLCRYLEISGIIDDFGLPNTSWNGIPIIKMADIQSIGTVLNTSTSISPVAVDDALNNRGIFKSLHMGHILKAPNCPTDLIPWFVEDQRAELRENDFYWHALRADLDDQLSKDTLDAVIQYRCTADLDCMRQFGVRLEDQYFEDFLHLKSEVFIDCGGYDGDTTEQFCRRCPTYRGIKFFEPSPMNMAKARTRLASYRDIEYFDYGCSDIEDSLGFDMTRGSASSVSSMSEHRIRVRPLDAAINEATFIKMDLEGHEMQALKGAAGLISRYTPKLAISVYHKASHFREVHSYVKSLCPTYKVRLRHYTQGWSETVMFFFIE
jgi:FkbM family methyltransferase